MVNMETFNFFVFIRALIVAITCVVHNSCEMWKRLELGHVNDENKMNNLAKFRINELSILKDEKTAQKNEKKKRKWNLFQ